MELLYWLENLRTPLGDTIFALLTQLEEETIFILIGLLFYWCIHKREGFYLLTVGVSGTILNQILKLSFKIPRPWQRDPNFTIVEAAREAATGYSFPSGHTQTAVGAFGGIARWNKQFWLRIVCILLCTLVAFSRMYLGVHTPWDVGVSILVATLLVFFLYPLMKKACDDPRTLRRVMLGLTIFALGYVVYVNLASFPADTDAASLHSGIKNAYTMLGCSAGLWVSFEIEEKYIHFDTKAVWWIQVLKLVLGLIPMLMIKSFVKAPLHTLFGGHLFADAVRYFLITVFAGCIWPITFKWFGKLKTK